MRRITERLCNHKECDYNSLPPPSLQINDREESFETVIESDRMNDNKLKLAFKIDRLRNKAERYESHVGFLKKCLDNNIIPNGLKCFVEPSIGNRDEGFLNQWHGILNDCSKQLINLTIEWSTNNIETTKTL